MGGIVRLQEYLASRLAHPLAVWVFDGSDFPKQGEVLDVYTRPYDPKRLMPCMDETSKQWSGRLGWRYRHGRAGSNHTTANTCAMR